LQPNQAGGGVEKPWQRLRNTLYTVVELLRMVAAAIMAIMPDGIKVV
jgi:hypothetical protein